MIRSIVIAHSFRFYMDEVHRLFDGEIKKRSGGVVTLKNGDTYQYISDFKYLRGHHGVRVLFWGNLPSWYLADIETANTMIRMARLP